MSQLLEFVKKYPGVHIRGESIAIDFRYQGVRCRETLKNVKATKANIKWAQNKRTVVLHEISTGVFDYRAHFPESTKANQFSPVEVVPTVEEAIDDWLAAKKGEVSKKTYGLLRNRIETHIKPKFGKRHLNDIKQSEIKKWRLRELGGLANKTINDVMTPLRGIFETAMADRIIDFNPCKHVPNLERDSEDNADPLTLDELNKFEQTETRLVSERNAFLFAAWTGLRISEWMALAWEDVDFEKRTIKVQRSVVRDDCKVPKTKGSVRTIHLLGQAYDILMAQKAMTFMMPPTIRSVGQSDKRRYKKESLSFVFLSTDTNEAYRDSNKYYVDFFEHHIKKSGIRRRTSNQARHTFASQLLTKGVSERWIMREMGHTSIQMFEKHYGRWIDDEMPDMADQVTKLFQMVTPRSQETKGIA